MKKKLVLKPFVLPTLYILMIITLVVAGTTIIYKGKKEEDNLTYVSETILDNSVPIIKKEEETILNPYTSDKVKIVTNYYDYKGESSTQENSIVRYDSTYLQNSGITYASEEQFDIVSVMDGTVTKIYNNDLLGQVVEITHGKNMISIYEMVTDVTVKENQKVTRGEIIAKSGTSKITTENYNLHFEFMKDGKPELKILDPLYVYGEDGNYTEELKAIYANEDIGEK